MVALVICMAMTSPSYSYASISSQSKAKAVFIFKFYKYIQWNATKSNTLCVYGQNPFGSVLDLIADKTSSKQKYNIQYVKSISELNQCGIVYVGKNVHRKLHDIFAVTNHSESNILTISDIKGFALRGGTIELVDRPKKLAIVLNKKTLDTTGLKANSQLLKMVELIK